MLILLWMNQLANRHQLGLKTWKLLTSTLADRSLSYLVIFYRSDLMTTRGIAIDL